MTAPLDTAGLVAEWRKAMEGVTPGDWVRQTEVEWEDDREQPEVYICSDATVCDYTVVATMGRAESIPADRKQADAAWIARCSPAGVSALLDALEAMGRELAEAREKLRLVDQDRVARGKLLRRVRDMLVNPRDHLDDAGDLVSFGSTNDADAFRDAVQMLEDWRWDDIIRERKLPDLVANCRKANRRATTAERALSESQAEGRRLREALDTAVRIDAAAKRGKSDGRVFIDYRDWEAFMAEPAPPSRPE